MLSSSFSSGKGNSPRYSVMAPRVFLLDFGNLFFLSSEPLCPLRLALFYFSLFVRLAPDIMEYLLSPVPFLVLVVNSLLI